MTLPNNLVDRELGKFRDSSDGPVVAVTNSDGTPIAESAISGDGISAVVPTSTTAAELKGTGGPLADRKGVYIMANNANNFLGFKPTMLAAEGLQLPNGQIIYIEAKSTASIYARRSSGTGSITVWEVK